ncbi:hypothetical protein PRNP1_006270 [Phytophthora ramorum]
MPKSHSTGDTGAAVEDHAAMKKQWQTNLEIDLLKSAWIRKDREQHGAHTSPPLSAGNCHSRATQAPDAGEHTTEGGEDAPRRRSPNALLQLPSLSRGRDACSHTAPAS